MKIFIKIFEIFFNLEKYLKEEETTRTINKNDKSKGKKIYKKDAKEKKKKPHEEIVKIGEKFFKKIPHKVCFFLQILQCR